MTRTRVPPPAAMDATVATPARLSRRAALALSALGTLPAWRALAPLIATSAARADTPLPCRAEFFDLLGHTGKPDLQAHGIRPIRIFAAQHLWGAGEDRNHLPSAQSVARAFEGQLDADSPVVLDIEHWPFRGAGVDETVTKMLGLLDLVRAQNVRGPIGYYGLMPLRDYWRAIRPGTQEFLDWQAENDRFRPVVEATDVLFPSLYTFYDDVAGWCRYAEANLTEARRFAGSRPVHVFLWAQYHGSNKLLGNQDIPVDYWRTQLDLVGHSAEGIVLWGGWAADGRRMVWNDAAPWWLETLDYFACCRGEVA